MLHQSDDFEMSLLSERFREEVCSLILCRSVDKHDILVRDAIAYRMEAYINVLGAFVHFRVRLRQFVGALVVDVKRCWIRVLRL